MLLRAQKSTSSCVSLMPPVFDPAIAFLSTGLGFHLPDLIRVDDLADAHSAIGAVRLQGRDEAVEVSLVRHMSEWQTPQ